MQQTCRMLLKCVHHRYFFEGLRVWFAECLNSFSLSGLWARIFAFFESKIPNMTNLIIFLMKHTQTQKRWVASGAMKRGWGSEQGRRKREGLFGNPNRSSSVNLRNQCSFLHGNNSYWAEACEPSRSCSTSRVNRRALTHVRISEALRFAPLPHQVWTRWKEAWCG